MSTLWIAVLAVGAGPTEVGDPAEQPRTSATQALEEAPAAAPGNAPAQLRAEIRAALRAEATAAAEHHEAAVRHLLALYQQLRVDSEMPERERLRLQGQMRIRLQSIARSVGRQGAHWERGADVVDESTASRPERPAVLAQQFRQPAGGAAQAAFGGGLIPPAGMPGVRPADQAANDNGQQLVELIRRTIAPASWDVNGGPGTIVYFGNLQALVVRQTGGVHGQLGGALGQLRRAGP